METKLLAAKKSNNQYTWKDREFSWLDFNERVLYQYQRKDMPVVNRVRFIGIADNNLAEFISVRFADKCNLEKEFQNNKNYIETLNNKISALKDDISNTFSKMNNEYHLIESVSEKNKFEKIFHKKVFPVLTVISTGTNKEVPVLDDKDLNFFVKMHPKDNPTETIWAFIQIPYQVNRFIEYKHKIYLLEDIVELFMTEIFNTSIIEDYVQFVVYKDYSMEVIHDKNESIIKRVNNVLLARKKNYITFIDIMKYPKRNSNIVKHLVKMLNINKKHIWITVKDKQNTNMLGLHILQDYDNDMIEDVPSALNYTNNYLRLVPKYPEELLEEDSIFHYLNNNDLIVHHPYESYDVVINFLREASRDPKVISIKQTLYRVSSSKSPIVQALCDASMNGIKVTVMLELLARFDERRNISLIQKLKEAGVNIIYSLEGFKTHCKMCLIARATSKGVTIYSHVGTGNYNEKTAKIYTDLSYFTSRTTLGADLNSIFNMISGFSRPSNLKSVSYSPLTLRPTLLNEIDWVITAPEETNNRNIYIKVNSISDKIMVDKILSVADDHPNITFNIICRGICSLPSRENIKIKSIVGRFLEHSRIYIFQVNKKWKVYISSADLLTRNLDKRVETLIKISDDKAKNKIKDIFFALWADTANSFTLNPNTNEWEKVNSEIYINSQNNLIK